MTSCKLNPVLAVLLAAGLLCGAAVYNGYPLVYPDTGGYLGLGSSPSFRSFFYNLFLCPALGLHSLWPVVFIQSLITAHLLGLVLRTVFGLASPWNLPLVMLPLALLSNLAWFTGFIMPDIFTGVLILAFFLLFFGGARLGRGEQLYLTGLAVVAITVHFSHLPLAIALVLVGGAMRLGARWLADFPPPALARGGAAVAIAVILLLANGYRTYGSLTMAPGGYAFPLARLVADGPAVRYLREHCPEKHYALCDYLDDLPANSDAFLWPEDSPFRKVGWVDGYRREGREIVMGTVLHYPFEVGRLMVRNSRLQLFMFNNWYGIAPFRHLPYPTNDIKAHFPGEFNAYLNCRQNDNTLGLKWFNLLHWGVIAGCVPLAGALWLRFRRRRQFLPVLLLAALAVAYGLSAVVTAAISGPHNRYGSRLIWLLPFFCIAAVLQLIRDRRRPA